MKRKCLYVMLIALNLLFLCACQTETLSISDYPLSAETIEGALSELGLEYRIVEDELLQKLYPNQSLFSLYDGGDVDFVGGISSGQKGGERILFISFPPFYMANPLAVEESEEAVTFATRLFGGFQDAGQEYDSFRSEYDKVNTERKQYGIQPGPTTPVCEGESHWKREVNGVMCRIASLG